MGRNPLVLGVIALAALGGPARGEKDKGGDLQGAWEVTQVTQSGETREAKFKTVVSFDGGKAAWTRDGKSFVEYSVTLGTGKATWAIDLSVTDAAGIVTTQEGIYHAEGDTLTFCLARVLELGQRPTEFKSGEGSSNTLVVLKRVKK